MRRFFEDEIKPTSRKHDEVGLVSMANMGVPNSNGSQFFFTMRGDDMQHLDGKHTVFAKVRFQCRCGGKSFYLFSILISLYTYVVIFFSSSSCFLCSSVSLCGTVIARVLLSSSLFRSTYLVIFHVVALDAVFLFQ